MQQRGWEQACINLWGGGRGGGALLFRGSKEEGASVGTTVRTPFLPLYPLLFLVASAGCYILTTSLAPFPPVRSVLLSCFLIFFRESRGLFYFCFVGGVLRVGGTGGGMHLLCRWDVRVGFLGGSKLGVKLCQKIK
jgi:hypothetical protein